MAGFDWSALASSIMAGVDSTTSLALGIANLAQQARANNLARSDQYYFYNDQKNYQSPAGQMAMRRSAGLNPYVDFSAGSVGQPSPVNTAAGMSDAYNLISSSLSRGAQNAFNVISQRIALKQLKLEEKKIDNETTLTKARAKLLESENYAQVIANAIRDMTKDNEVMMSDYQLQSMLNRLISEETVNRYQSDLFQAQIDSYLERVFASQYDRESYKPQTLRNSKRDYDLRFLDYNLRRSAAEDAHNKALEELRRLEYDNSSIDALEELLKHVPDDKKGAKGTLKGIINIIKYIVSSKK